MNVEIWAFEKFIPWESDEQLEVFLGKPSLEQVTKCFLDNHTADAFEAEKLAKKLLENSFYEIEVFYDTTYSLQQLEYEIGQG